MRSFAIIVLVCGLISLANRAEAIDVVVTGNWSLTIDASNLNAGAGSDLNNVYESVGGQVLVAILNTTGNDDSWRVDVKRTDTNWHSDFVLSVERTGDGTGGGSITGGEARQVVNTTDNAFFSGAGDRTDIPIRLRLEGVSVRVPPDTYSTTITYTVVDIS